MLKLRQEIVSFFITLNAKDVFCFGIMLAIIACIANVVLIACKKDYGQSKRIWQYVVYLCIAIFQFSSESATKDGALKGYMLSILILLCIPSIVIKRKDKSTTRQQLELVKRLDEEIKRDNLEKNEISNEKDFFKDLPTKSTVIGYVDKLNQKLSKPETQPLQRQESKDLKLDFSHVKNVISRLDAFGLNQSDRKLVEDLQMAVAEAEQGECMPDLKNRINDGLGALLKIMSKYGV